MSASFVLAAGLRPVLSAVDQTLDTTTQKTFQVLQTAATSGTGTITWSYSLPSGVSVFSSDGTQITFLITGGLIIKPQTFVVTATNQVGQKASKSIRLAAGVKPVLVSPGPLSFDTSTTFRSFSVAQIAAAGEIQWSYVLPGGAKVISSTNSELVIGIDAGKYVEPTNMVVTATSAAGIVSIPVSFDVSAYIAPVVAGSDQFLDTSTLKTFTLTQTVSPSATGAITWSYTGGGSPTFVSSSDSQITFSFTTGGAYRNAIPFTVTARNVLGVTASKTITLTSGSTPVLSAAATTLIVDTSVARTYAISQLVDPLATGPLAWNGGYPPSTITYTNTSDAGTTLNVAQGAIISTPAVFSVVAASAITRLTSAPLEFSIRAAGTPVLVSPGAQNLDTLSGNAFTIAQTAPYTGGVTWSYSPQIPANLTRTDSGLLFSLAPGTSFPPTIITVTATNVIGVTVSVALTVTAAVKPVLVSPTQLALDTTTQQTFTIAQTSPGAMSWSYTFPPAGVTVSTADSGITFTIAAETYFSPKNFVVQATNLAQVSTLLGVHLSAGVAAGVTMNFGGSRIGAVTDDGVFQVNGPPPGMSYPSASLFLASPSNPQTYDVYGQPYGNGEYTMAASSASTNMSNAFSFTENVEWSSSADVYSDGAYTGGQVTYVDSVARSGEWIQLRIPDSIIVSSIQLIEVGGANATSYVIAGSNDGAVWHSVYEGTGTASATDFFTTVLSVTGVTTAYTTYRYIATATNPASTLTSLGGFQVIGAASYVSPKLVNPRKLTFIVTAEQLFSVQQTSDPAATGTLSWSTTPYIVDNSPLPATVTTPNISIANPYTNAVNGSFTGLIELTDPKLDVDILGSDFTIEFWVYGTSPTNFGTVISRAASATLASLIDWQFYQDASSTYFQMNTFRVGVERKVLSPFVWNHVAIVGTHGQTLLYVNGLEIARTATIVGSYTAGRSIFIGGGNTGTLFTGYLADVRIVTGYAVYASNFTVPSAPLTDAQFGQTLLLLQVKPTLPSGFSVNNATSSGITFAIAAGTIFAGDFTVQVQNFTGDKSIVTFLIDTTPTVPALSAATPFIIPTYVPTTFAVFQTASPSLTGVIDWSYTTLPAGITETIPKDDTQITFAVDQYAVPYQQSFTVSASGDFGLTSLIVVYTGYGNTPVLTSASPYVIASSAGTTFTVNQTALYTGTITWSYGTLPSGVSFSSSDDTGITFAVATNSTSSTVVFSVTASCFYGTSSTNISYTSAPPAGPVSSIVQTGSTSNPSISLSWTPGSGATSYSIASSPATTTQTTSTVPYTFTGLSGATVYTFTITSGNFIGAYSSPVDSGNMYTSAAPSALVVGTISGTSIPLSWTAGFGATSYEITSSPATTTQTTSGTSLTFTGLTGGTPYLFTIRSIVPNGTGGSVSSGSYVTPAAAVGSITSITITSLSSVTVTWPSSPSASSYSIKTTPATTTQTTSAVSLVKTGLTVGVDYTVSVTSINAYGTGGVTTSSSFVIPNSVTNLSLGNQQITTVDLAWTPAYGATGYTITTTPATTTQTTSDPTYTFTGLSGGTLYTFTVVSTNSFGTGDSATSASILTRPAAVTGISPSNYSLTTVDMSWTAATGATSYTITTTPTTTTQTTAGTSITKTGLTAGTSYIVNIQSVNASGNGGTASSISFFTLPLAVTNLTPSNPQITTADLTWSAATGATSYKITTSPVSTTQTTTGTSFTKTGLVGGTTYTFTVTSVNSSGEGGSVISTASIVTRPAAVLGLTASNPQNTSMGLSWTASPSDIPVTYTITTSPVTTTQTTTETTLTKTSLDPGILYTYYVLATNASGDGGTSNTTKITLPPQVTSVATTNPQQTTMGLTWTDALSATSYSIASSPAVATSPQTAPVGGAYTFTGLTAGIQYTFTVTSINGSGSGTVTVSPAAVYTLSPSVASVTLSNPKTTTMDITWPASTGATSYDVTSTPATTTQTLSSGGTFTGLTAGTVYTFTVAAVNSSGSGGTTTSASKITLSLPPASLTPAPAAAVNYIDLSWPNAVGAVSYTVVSTPATVTNSGVTGTNLRFYSLASGTNYTFTISSVNASGTSETSTTSASALTLPDPPASITPSNATITTVDLNWTAAIGTDTYTITTTPVSTTKSGLSGTSYTFPDLLSGTSYTFTIRSVNASGTSPASTTSVAYFTIPAAVPALNTSNPQQTSIDLGWTDVTGESQYTITSTPSVGYTAILPANTSSVTFPAGGSGYSLTAGTSYVFRITPSNSSGSGAYTDSVAKFTLPAPPTLSATSIGGVFTSIQRNQLTVNWIAPAIGTTTGYIVSCPGLTTQTITAPTVSATFTSLPAGTSYTFTIQSTNASGAGGSVVTAAVFTLPDAVTAPTTSAYTLTGMTVGWTAATGATKYNISGTVSPAGGNVPTTQMGVIDTTANFTGLSSGYSYTFTISSVNDSGTGDLTTATTAAKTLSPAPGQPTLTGVALPDGTTQIQIALSSFARGATSNTFTPYVSAVAGTPQTSAVYPYTFTSLSPNTQYTFTVQSVNSSGSGTTTSVQSAALYTLPNPVTLSATDVGGVFTSIQQAQMTVNWNAPTGGAATYNVSAASTDGGSVPASQSGISGTSATFLTLTPGKTYNFTITAVNSAGSSSTVTTNNVKTLSPAPAAAPASSSPTQTSAVITWSAATGATSYLVSSTPAVATSPQTLASGGTFTGLDPNTVYNFSVQSVNSSGNGGTSAIGGQTVTLTYAPTLSTTIVGGVFTSITSTGFTINWLAPSTGTATSYAFSGTGVGTGTTTGLSTPSLTVTAGSTNGPFTITSRNQAGVNGDSVVTTTIKTQAAAATSFQQQAGTATNQTLVLTWTNATGAESYILTGSGITPANPATTQSTGYTVSGLASPGTGYTFTLQSRNNVALAGGPSLGGSIGPITAYTSPSAPSSLATGTPTATTIPFTWSAPAGTITTYRLTGSGIAGGFIDFNYATSPSSYTLSGLSAATTYGPFTLTATNTGGTSAASNQAAAVTTSLGAPTGLNVTGVSTSGFTLNWTAALGAASYTIVGGPGLGNQTTSGLSAGFSGLAAGTGYGPITVTAWSGAGGTGTAGEAASTGSGTSGTVYTVPNAPGAPFISTGTASTSGFTATWTAPGGTIASYSITGTGSPTPTSYTPATNSQAYTGLTAGNGYVFTVTATGPAGFLNTSGPATIARTSAASSGGTIYTLSPGPSAFAAGATDPRLSSYGNGFSGGALIQSGALEIGYGTAASQNIAFATNPTFTPGATAVYSMTFDIFVTSDAPSWRNIFNHGPSGNADALRTPALFITGNTDGSARLHWNHVTQVGSSADRSVGSVLVPKNQWYTVTATCDGTTIRIYMDGAIDNTATFGNGTFKWPATADSGTGQNWYWNCAPYANAGGSIQIKNCYFWNGTCLTATQASYLAYPIASTRLTLGWTAANGATSYTTAGTGLTTYSVSDRFIVYSGLAGNSTYGTFTVYSINGSSNGATNGGSTTAGAQTTPPGAPTISSATATAYNNITVSWGAIGGASSYTLSGYNIVPAITGIVGTSYNLATAGGTTYGPFTVTAVNGNGSTASATFGAVTTVPAPVTGFSITARTTTSITFGWGGAAGATSFTLSGTGFTTVTGITGTSYTLGSLAANSSYGGFTLTPVGAAGNGTAGTAAAGYTSPNAPTSVVATVTAATTATVTWTAPSGTITSYTVTGGGTHAISGTTDTVTGLTTGTNYTFTVTATNSTSGLTSAGAASNQITAGTFYTMTFPFTFTNMGATGSSGPLTVTYPTASGSGQWPGYGTGSQLFLSGGIQNWTVPSTRNYTFVVAGAGIPAHTNTIVSTGGIASCAASYGVIVTTTVSLTAGTVLKILVGQQGLISPSGGTAPGNFGQGKMGGAYGGCGGSFVVSGTSTPVVVAGASGGPGQSQNPANGAAGSITTSGTTSPVDTFAGGTGGLGGATGTINTSFGSYISAGGGGLTGNGATPNYGPQTGGKSFTNGGVGGTYGGFGGGGGTGGQCMGGGGGGGYSGGGAGGTNAQGVGGGGGGSFVISGATGTSYSVTNTGMGYVTIT